MGMKYKILIFALFNCQVLLSMNSINISSEAVSLEDLLDTKVSTASKYEQNITDAPASITVVTAEEIKQYGYRTLAEVLSKEAGFFISDDRNCVYLGTRGFQIPDSYNNKVLLLIDGHRVNDAVYGSSYINNEFIIDLSLVEKIEIVRGPGSVLYGTNAMFGVINIITKNAKRINGLEMSGLLGSYGENKVSIIMGHELSETSNIVVGLLYGKEDGRDFYFSDYDTDTTNFGNANGIDNSRYFGGYFSASLEDFKLSGYYSNHKKNIPTGKYETDFNSKDLLELDNKWFLELKYDKSLNEVFSINSRAYFDYYYFEGFYPYASLIEKETNESNTIGFEVQAIYDFTSNHRLTGGIEYSNNYVCNYIQYDEDIQTFKIEKPYSLFALYLNDNFQIIDELALSVGVSQDFYSNSLKSTNPRAAVIITPGSGSVIKLLYGQAFRRPTIYENDYYDTDYQLKSEDLKPETITTYEIIYDQKLFSFLLASVSAFHYNLKNIIENYEISDNLSIFKNFTESSANGIEISLNYINDNFNVYGNYSYMRNKVENKDVLVSYPSHLIKIGCAITPVETFTVSVSVNYETERETKDRELIYPFNKLETPAFAIANLHILWEPKIDDSADALYNNFVLSLKFNNITDTKYYHPTGVDNKMDRILQSGFNCNFCLSVKI